MLNVNKLHMKIKYSVVLAIAFTFLVLSTVVSNAVSLQSSIAVCLNDKENKPVNNIGVTLYQIAVSDYEYHVTENFKDSGISIDGVVNNPSLETAKAIYEYILNNNISGDTAISENGEVLFENTESGIYLISCTSYQKYKFNPYLVFVPDKEIDDYNVITTPKVEENMPDNRSIYVVKKWQDDNDKRNKRPDTIKINLKRNDEIIDSVLLSESNGWSHTFTHLQDEGKYAVEEVVVKNYSVFYSGDSENGFVVTNVYDTDGKLPQTGLIWWPVPIILVVGFVFVLSGILAMKGKKDEEK